MALLWLLQILAIAGATSPASKASATFVQQRQEWFTLPSGRRSLNGKSVTTPFGITSRSPTIRSSIVSQTTPSLPYRSRPSSLSMVAYATDFSTSATIRIAVTREDGKNEKLIGALFKAIASSTTVLSDEVEVLELPCIAHADGADYGRLRETLSDQEWSYVAITSPEAARVLASAWPFGTNTGTTSAPTPKIAAVGKATEQALQDAGIAVSFCPSKATAETLVQELPKQLDGSSTLNVLYPASTKAADTLQEGLQARGFVVTRLNTYDTVTAEWNDGYRASARACRIACFASPSAVKGWVHNTQKDIDLSTTDNGNGGSIITLAACIGETSAKACRKLGWTDETIFSAEQPGMDGWVQAILDAVAYCQSTAIPATLMSVENTTDTAPMLPPA